MTIPSKKVKITAETVIKAVKYLKSIKPKCNLCGAETLDGNMYFVRDVKPLFIRMCDKCAEKVNK